MQILLAILVVIFFSPSRSLADPITIASGEFAPYSGYALYKNGFACHVISESFKRVGHSVQYVFLPWKRSYLEAKSGTFQATSTWVTNPQRLGDFYYSQPVYNSTTLLYHLKSNPISQWEKLSDLKSYRFGATREYTYTEEFWNLHSSGVLNVQITNTDQSNLHKLLFKRIDIFPLNEIVATELISEHFSDPQGDEFIALLKPISDLPSSIIFPKILEGSKKRREDFNRGLKILKKDGTYDKMYKDLLSGKYSIKE